MLLGTNTRAEEAISTRAYYGPLSAGCVLLKNTGGVIFSVNPGKKQLRTAMSRRMDPFQVQSVEVLCD